MKIQHEFTVDQPLEAVWDFFQDIPSVAQCLPGAELKEAKGDNLYAGTVSVKFGPMTALFDGEAVITPDADARRVRISGKGADKRGGSRGKVTVDYALTAAAAGATTATIDADVSLSGPAAQFGRTGVINDISQRLIRQFVACLEAKLKMATKAQADDVVASEVRGFALFFSALWSRLKKLLRGDR